MAEPKSPRPTNKIEEELTMIGAISLIDLRALWRERWDDLPAFRSREHLARAMAYRVQAEQAGDLGTASRRRLLDLADQFKADKGYTPALAVSLKPGSSLVREWGGKRHEVAVTGEGYLYDGRAYGSLSKIAAVITGTKWNGPVFFGVKPRRAA
jgi:hypothetical protein